MPIRQLLSYTGGRCAKEKSLKFHKRPPFYLENEGCYLKFKCQNIKLTTSYVDYIFGVLYVENPTFKRNQHDVRSIPIMRYL